MACISLKKDYSIATYFSKLFEDIQLKNSICIELSDLINHPQANQIELDVRRMGSMIPKSLSSEENENLIKETKRLALSILAEYPNLHYYQVCC